MTRIGRFYIRPDFDIDAFAKFLVFIVCPIQMEGPLPLEGTPEDVDAFARARPRARGLARARRAR